MVRKRKCFDDKVFSTSFGLQRKDLEILDTLIDKEKKSASSIIRDFIRGKR